MPKPTVERVEEFSTGGEVYAGVASAWGSLLLIGKSSPPRARLPRRKLALQSRRGLTSRHGDLRQSQCLGHDAIGPVALSLEVRPVTGRTGLESYSASRLAISA